MSNSGLEQRIFQMQNQLRNIMKRRLFNNGESSNDEVERETEQDL